MEILIGIILSLLFIYCFIFFICYKILVPIMDAIYRFFEKIFSPLMGKLAEKRLKKTTSKDVEYWITRKNEEEKKEKEFYKKEIEPYPLRAKYYHHFKNEIENLLFHTKIQDIGYKDKLLEKKDFLERLDDFIQFYQNNVEAFALRKKYYDQYFQFKRLDFIDYKSIVSTKNNERLECLRGLDDYIKIMVQMNSIQSVPPITNTIVPCHLENGTPYYYWIIKNTTPKRFASIREYAANKINGCSIPLLERGVSPLSTERELNQYIFSYGNMHYAKLKSALSYLPASLFQEALEIIDWGCGQGIAIITLLELKRPKNVKFTLIEPGLLALKRAALNTKCFFEAYTSGTFNCKTINKGFDDLIKSDVSTSSNRTKIHLFSNTLDIEGRYSQTELINLIKNTQSGKNYFICCSPYINFEKRQKIDNFVNCFKRMSNFHLYYSVDNSMDDDWWECNRHFKGYNRCSYKDCEDCIEKWTRIIRVFSVEL